jgi:CMP-N,N'-diacetyllegionaminic acid synthase
MNEKQEQRQNREVLAVVMARGGSVGLPGKSLKLLLGKPVLAYTLEHVRASRLITRSIISSDDPAILNLARKQGFEALERPPELATATSATDPVLRHALKTLYASIGLPFATVMLYGNVPIRANNMIDRCIQMLIDTGADSVQTIAPVGKMHPYWMFDRAEDGRIAKHIPNTIFRRQDLPPLYSPTGAVYVIRSPVLMAAENNPDPHAFLGTDRRGLLVSPEDSVDIDTPKDLYIAEAMLRAAQEKG